ncbi:MAG: DUF1800 domain-containing protein [Bacteroidetes bacterium]|nr:DUF1800 domain-containing protein [Bacteroidota bacterium]
MKQIIRSEFLSRVSGATLDEDVKSKNIVPNEFYNKDTPHFGSRATSGLNPYSGTFGKAELSHLLRRTLFGVAKADMDHFNGMALSQVLTAILTASATPQPPLNAYNDANFTDADIPFGQTWVNASNNANSVNANGRRRNSLKQWWAGLILNQDRNITEKMNLFWHNHFATETVVISDSRFAYKHHALLRANALGNFKTLTKLVTTDPGMLAYLNGDTNTKNSPNENYGRELQELFTIGKGPDSHYTEDDVKAAAKALTGWKIDRNTVTSYFDSTKHDTTDKQFSSFYNNTVIVGQAGTNGANESDQLIDMLFLSTETAKFISRKLYRFFVYYVIDQQVESDIITPMADIIRTNNYDILPALRALLESEHFFDPLNIGCHIKNPVDHLAGIARQYNIAFPDSSNLGNQYKGWGILATSLNILTMDLGDPPNVAGWPAYYQEPAFHELWINSNTLPYRNQVSDLLGSLTGFKSGQVILKIDFIAFADQTSDPSNPNTLIADSAGLLSPSDLGTTQSDFLKSILLSNQTADHYWTDAWNLYKADTSNQTNKTIVETRLRSMYTYLMNLAEYQLI